MPLWASALEWLALLVWHFKGKLSLICVRWHYCQGSPPPPIHLIQSLEAKRARSLECEI